MPPQVALDRPHAVIVLVLSYLCFISSRTITNNFILFLLWVYYQKFKLMEGWENECNASATSIALGRPYTIIVLALLWLLIMAVLQPYGSMTIYTLLNNSDMWLPIKNKIKSIMWWISNNDKMLSDYFVVKIPEAHKMFALCLRAFAVVGHKYGGFFSICAHLLGLRITQFLCCV